jgi:hypothetical protein
MAQWLHFASCIAPPGPSAVAPCSSTRPAVKRLVKHLQSPRSLLLSALFAVLFMRGLGCSMDALVLLSSPPPQRAWIQVSPFCVASLHRQVLRHWPTRRPAPRTKARTVIPFRRSLEVGGQSALKALRRSAPGVWTPCLSTRTGVGTTCWWLVVAIPVPLSPRAKAEPRLPNAPLLDFAFGAIAQRKVWSVLGGALGAGSAHLGLAPATRPHAAGR